VRASGNAGPLAAALRREIATLDVDLPVFGTQTLAQYRSDRLAESRLGSGLLGIFGSLALLLASVGVYAVISFAVTQRTREIGVRVALGALHREVVSLFVRQGMRLTMTGVGIGLVLSIGVAKLLSSVFFGIAPDDVPTALGVATVLAIVALLACWVPAQRAAKVDPMEALRHE
jgi:ABC-type antimicrobial peptide transport system permease subunit